MSTTCIICNKELKWGGFAYDQKMCIDCFQINVEMMVHNIAEYYPTGMRISAMQDINMIIHMFNVMAETYGHSNRILRCC